MTTFAGLKHSETPTTPKGPAMDEITWPRALHHRTLEAFVPRSPEEGMRMLAEGWALSPAAFCGDVATVDEAKDHEPDEPVTHFPVKRGRKPRKA